MVGAHERQGGKHAGRRVGRVHRRHREELPRARVGRCTQLRAEEGAGSRPGTAAVGGNYLAEHPDQLLRHFRGRLKPHTRVRVGRLLQEAVEGLVTLEDRYFLRLWQPHGVALLVLEPREIGREDQKGPRNRVEVRCDARTGFGDLRRLVADRAIQVAVGVVRPAYTPQVDELELFLGLNGVVRLEVTEQQTAAVQEPDSREDLEDVGDGLRHGEGTAFLLPVPAPDLAQRLPAHILHDDVTELVVLNEVVDLDDVGVLYLGQESSLRDGSSHRGFIARIEESLQNDPSI